MKDTRFLRGSDGTGNAIAARVNATRIIGSTTIKVDAVTKWPAAAFIATSGTLNTNGYLDSALGPITEFRGHITAGDIIIDSYEAGYSDQGHLANQYVILKQTTGWSNLVQDSLIELQNEDVLRHSEIFSDYVDAGGVWSATTGLNASMTALTAYQAGYRATLTAIASRAFTASRDTYVDILRGGTTFAPTFTAVYTEALNNAASPALAANSIRIAKVITGTSAITSTVNTAYDSLTNPIRPSAPIRKADLEKAHYGKAYFSTGGGSGGTVISAGIETAANFDTLDPNSFGMTLVGNRIKISRDGNYEVTIHAMMSDGATTSNFIVWLATFDALSNPYARLRHFDRSLVIGIGQTYSHVVSLTAGQLVGADWYAPNQIRLASTGTTEYDRKNVGPYIAVAEIR